MEEKNWDSFFFAGELPQATSCRISPKLLFETTEKMLQRYGKSPADFLDFTGTLPGIWCGSNLEDFFGDLFYSHWSLSIFTSLNFSYNKYTRISLNPFKTDTKFIRVLYLDI